jgi:hypothetical protein
MPTPEESAISNDNLSAALENMATAIRESNQKTAPVQKVWNSLEISKLVVSAVTSIAILLLGIYVANIEHRASALTDARIKSYDAMKMNLNQIHCYVKDFGTWKESTPETIIKAKRELDTEMFSDQGLWSEDTFAAFKSYEETAFGPFRGSGLDASIKAPIGQKAGLPNWHQEWKDAFSDPDPRYDSAYDNLYKYLMKDITH